jgi:hypothetical protein
LFQRTYLFVWCLYTLGFGQELDFIEYEIELKDGYSYGDGWKWNGPDENIIEDHDYTALESGRSDKSSSSSSSSSSDSESDSDSDGKDKVSYLYVFNLCYY